MAKVKLTAEDVRVALQSLREEVDRLADECEDLISVLKTGDTEFIEDTLADARGYAEDVRLSLDSLEWTFKHIEKQFS